MIQREEKRKRLVKKYASKRNEILKQLISMKEKMTIVLVSHSEEPLKIADEIYELES